MSRSDVVVDSCPGRRRGHAVCGILVVAAGLSGCAAPRPIYELTVHGHVQSLTTSGTALAVEFVGSGTYVWDWGDLTKAPAACGRRSAGALLGGGYVIGEMPADQDRPQPAVVARQRPSDRVVRTWPFSAGWYCAEFCGSANGRYVGILLEEGRPSGGDTCLGLIGPGTREIPWLAARGRVVKLADDGMAISNNGRYLALLGLGDIRMLTVADVAARKLLWQRPVQGAQSVAFSPDGTIVYIGGLHGIHALQSANGRPLDSWSPELASTAPVTRVAASPDGHLLAAGTDLPDGRVHLLEARTAKRVTSWAVTGRGDGGRGAPSLRARKTRICGLAFSPGGKLLATADSLSGRVRIWQVPQEPSRPPSRFAWKRSK